MTAEINIVEQCLEPLACADESITMDRELLVQTSIAVSLKRIADALTLVPSHDIYPPLARMISNGIADGAEMWIGHMARNGR